MTPERRAEIHFTELEGLAREHSWPDHANHCKECGHPNPCPTTRLVAAYRELLAEIDRLNEENAKLSDGLRMAYKIKPRS